MQAVDVDMEKREPPVCDEPANRKKPKLDDDDGHDEWSGWYTASHLEKWMGTHFALLVGRDAKCRLAKPGKNKPVLTQFLVTHEMVQIYHDSDKTRIGPCKHEVGALKSSCGCFSNSCNKSFK